MGNEEIAKNCLLPCKELRREVYSQAMPNIVQALNAKDLSHQKVVEGLQGEITELSSLADELFEWAEHDRDCIISSQRAGRPTPDGGYEMLFGYGKQEKWYRETPKCTCSLGKILDRYTSWKGGKK